MMVHTSYMVCILNFTYTPGSIIQNIFSDKLPAAIELIPSFILLLSLNLAYCNDIKLLKVHSIRMNPWFLFSNLDEEDGNVDLDPSSFLAKEEECNLPSSG